VEDTKLVYIDKYTVSVQTEEDEVWEQARGVHKQNNKLTAFTGGQEEELRTKSSNIHPPSNASRSSLSARIAATTQSGLPEVPSGKHDESLIGYISNHGDMKDEIPAWKRCPTQSTLASNSHLPEVSRSQEFTRGKSMSSSASLLIHTIEETTEYSTHIPVCDGFIDRSTRSSQSVVLLPSRAASTHRPIVPIPISQAFYPIVSSSSKDEEVWSPPAKRPQVAWGKSFTVPNRSGGCATSHNNDKNDTSPAVVPPWRRAAYVNLDRNQTIETTPAGAPAQEEEVVPWKKRESGTYASTSSLDNYGKWQPCAKDGVEDSRVLSLPPGQPYHSQSDGILPASPGQIAQHLLPKPLLPTTAIVPAAAAATATATAEKRGNAPLFHLPPVPREEKRVNGRLGTTRGDEREAKEVNGTREFIPRGGTKRRRARGAAREERGAYAPFEKKASLPDGSKNNTPCDTTFFTASKAIQDFGKLGKWEEAVGVLRSMKDMNVKPNVVNFNLAISACGQKKQWECALKLLEEMQDESIEPNVITYNTAISACGKAMKWDRAMGLLEHMKTKQVQPDKLSYNSTISACGKGMKPEMALNLLEEMKQLNVKPDVISYNASISACGVAQKWENALLLLDDMKKQRLEPDVISYNAAISACEKGARADKALELLEVMKTQNVDPNIITYSAAISACEKGMKWEKALELLEEIKQWDIQPSVIAYSAAISACEKGVQPEMAMKLLEKMKTDNLEPSVISYTSAISACAKGLQPEKALDLFKEMKSRGVFPNVISYNAAMSACEKAANPEKALELLNEMRAVRVEPDKISYSTAISACGKGMQPDMAMKLLEDMKSVNLHPNIITYSAAISACENAGRYEDAERLYREAYATRSYDPWLGGKKNCVIDFRSYPLAIAKAALRVILHDYKEHGLPAKNPELIVGRGTVGSDGHNDAVLRPALLEMLKTEFHGALRTKPKENSARLLITRSSIAAWAKGEGF